ncbi:MAG TPA: RimK/LysX family protein, partial [Aestuariivirga sp.]|nr:RimK/LysX family protein [Aestuariivirga sp.]
MPTLRPTLYPLPLIGWRERVVLPKLGLGPLIAKVDTGARSAALHAEDISIRGSHVRFAIPSNGRKHHYELPIKGQRRVKSTSGHSEMRAVVETEIAIGLVKFTAEITLTNRMDMGVP